MCLQVPLRQARPVRWRRGGREEAPGLENEKEESFMERHCWNMWIGVCVCVCPQSACIVLGSSFKFSAQ